MSKRKRVKLEVEQHSESERLPPVVGLFAHGCVEPASKWDDDRVFDENNPVPTFELYRHSGNETDVKSKSKIKPPTDWVLHGQTKTKGGNSVTYMGRTIGAHGDTTGTSYAIAVYDAATGVAKVCPVASGHIFRIVPRLENVEYEYRPTEEDLQFDADVRTRIQLDNRLAAEFGSAIRKRAKKRMSDVRVGTAAAGAMMEARSMMSTAYEEAVRLGHTKDAVDESALKEMRAQLPPHHADATTAADAYRMNEIITMDSEALAIGRIYTAQEDETERQQFVERKRMAAYTASRVKPLLDACATTNERKHVARWLAMLDTLLRAQKGSYVLEIDNNGYEAGMKRFAKRLNVPRAAVETLLDLFYERGVVNNNEWLRTAMKKEFMLKYICICALMAEGGSMTDDCVAALCEQLQLSAADIQTRFRALGCVCVKNKRSLHQTYFNVELLNPLRNKAGDPPITLQDCFPALPRLPRGK